MYQWGLLPWLTPEPWRILKRKKRVLRVFRGKNYCKTQQILAARYTKRFYCVFRITNRGDTWITRYTYYV